MSRPVLPSSDPSNFDAFVKEWIPVLREFFNKRTVMDSFTWDPPNVGATSTVSTTLTSATVPELVGLRSGMWVRVTPPSDTSDDLTIESVCSGDNSLTIKLRNDTGGAINQGEGTW